nr:MAG: ORF1 [Torque teno midi virus]
MPFWWGRRRKYWYGTRYRKWGRRKPKYKTRRKARRRRFRRAPRRRRRRRKKVRRKLKKITVKQWQPESIQRCKIKGFEVQLLGAEGCQHRCYTAYKYEWTIPKAPAGGGFSSELYTLKYLYQEWGYRYNIWTRSNDYRDLCRYTGCTFTFFRDPETDFIIAYDINPPFTLDKFTYMTYHPLQLLLRQHKKILLSRKRHPTGKMKLKLKIKPPKQMSTKWFFQQYFADFGLVNIITAAANFDYPLLGCCNENQIIHIYYLNTTFYTSSTWGLFHSQPYKPNTQMPTQQLQFKTLIDGKQVTISSWATPTNYNDSISYDKGWFSQKILNIFEWVKPQIANLPCGVARYNMNLDSGHGNKVWLTPINAGVFNVPRDEDLFLENYPLWLIFYGYTSFIKQKKNDDSYFSAYMFVVKSDAIKPLQGATHQEYYPFIDRNFMNGKAPGDTYLDNNMKLKWYPTVKAQLETINSIVETGPFIPRYNNQRNSNWQLNSKYCFYFKWGGAQPTDQTVADPTKQPHWDVPDRIQQGVQVSNPKDQKWETIFKPWDYRRGTLTKTALKRMYEHLQSDESILSDPDQTPQKKKRRPPTLKVPEQETQKISTCLHSLFEKSTSQESQQAPQETSDLLKLIQQQKQQQQQIKLNLFTLIQDLKTHQKAIQYQTGLLN